MERREEELIRLAARVNNQRDLQAFIAMQEAQPQTSGHAREQWNRRPIWTTPTSSG